MDVLAILGAIIAFGAVISGNFLEGGQLTALINAPAAIIVIGGTLGAVILQSPYPRLRRAVQLLRWVVLPPRLMLQANIDRITEWSRTSRKQGLLGLENVLDAERDPFIRKGLEMVVDGSEPHTIRRALETELSLRTEFDLAAAAVYRSMGGYSPTIGIIGAVLGLIQVMGNLADPSQLGQGIATAFVATIYGVGFANLLLLPIGNKLKAIAQRQSRYREMLLEGILSIAEGENPRSIELKLQGFMD